MAKFVLKNAQKIYFGGKFGLVYSGFRYISLTSCETEI